MVQRNMFGHSHARTSTSVNISAVQISPKTAMHSRIQQGFKSPQARKQNTHIPGPYLVSVIKKQKDSPLLGAATILKTHHFVRFHTVKRNRPLSLGIAFLPKHSQVNPTNPTAVCSRTGAPLITLFSMSHLARTHSRVSYSCPGGHR